MPVTLDRGEAERLVHAYSDLILRLSYTYLKSTDDAQDICQTVFLKLLQKPQAFSSPEHEKAWIIRTAVNLSKDHLKSGWRRATVALDAAEAVPAPAEEEGSLLSAVNLLPPAPDIQEILNRPVTKAAYTEELNAASVVFHNRRTQEASTDDILMTGDASPETLDALAELLYENYYIIKAPHHGTASHWSHLLSEISSSHILVSNGDYQKAGKIAPAYLELPAVKHCTNCSACDWYAVSGCSCNRMAVCYDLANGAGLTIKCPYVCGAQQSPDCGIFIVGATGRRSCLCDNLPVQIN